MTEDEVEAVARAFYSVLDAARGWQLEPEVLKERFRRDARAAIQMLDQHREPVTAKVLVVEDDEAIRDLAVFYLEEAGFNVITTATGDEAVELLQSGVAPDVLFTDIRMPGRVDGWAVAKAYRKHFPSLPVLYGTQFAQADAAVEGAKIFPKPYKMSHVVSYLAELLMSGAITSSGARQSIESSE
ncbi:response regulator [Microvirga sp. G4-2]|uniref:response regulator n=1 Tax=Microvirga sp. G4-2 TaxID=3434467 RepID=UPI004043D156